MSNATMPLVGAEVYPVLFLTGLAAGFVDAIAGGGGLITIPVVLSLGLAPNDGSRPRGSTNWR